jgi:hypothetical protein
MSDSWLFADIEGQWEPEWELDLAFARSVISGTVADLHFGVLFNECPLFFALR